jgi:hypothetical protein
MGHAIAMVIGITVCVSTFMLSHCMTKRTRPHSSIPRRLIPSGDNAALRAARMGGLCVGNRRLLTGLDKASGDFPSARHTGPSLVFAMAKLGF